MNKKIIALIAGGLIVLAAIIYFVFIRNYDSGVETPGTNETNQTTEAPAVVSTSTPEAIPGKERTAEEKQRDDVSQLSLSFTERYGSSSNQADFSNLKDLELFMTEAMRARTESYIAAERAKPPVDQYQGITTKAIVAEAQTLTDSAATMIVKTKRQETKEGEETKTYSQDLTLSLKKINGEWKIDSAEWSK